MRFLVKCSLEVKAKSNNCCKYNLRNQNLLIKVITIDIKEEFQSVI
jgi:hypothetical protein